MLPPQRTRDVLAWDEATRQILSEMALPPSSKQVFCPVGDGGVRGGGAQEMKGERDEKQAREFEHSTREEKGRDRDEKKERGTRKKGRGRATCGSSQVLCSYLRVAEGSLCHWGHLHLAYPLLHLLSLSGSPD